ncbi:uracil phosphoribosyltransferase [Euzebya tangerina]|uniref:uracil phosphoribosyltransferase n=1 Tax=Euzebya tangerina TaxID=591198 RepID=UPI000E30F566|nr:uracil phosphoribosyltransferase [Euzebya tangerina]
MASTSVYSTASTAHYLDQLKDTSRGRATFRDALFGITTLLVSHALHTLEDPAEIVLVPIIRGGLGMVDGALAASPGATVGHVGIYRDRTTGDIIEYYSRVPDFSGQTAIILDPMVASGGTALGAADVLASAGYESICVATVVASEAGCGVLDELPAISHVFVCEIDAEPPEIGTLRNGLGDAGARLYGTA